MHLIPYCRFRHEMTKMLLCIVSLSILDSDYSMMIRLRYGINRDMNFHFSEIHKRTMAFGLIQSELHSRGVRVSTLTLNISVHPFINLRKRSSSLKW